MKKLIKYCKVYYFVQACFSSIRAGIQTYLINHEAKLFHYHIEVSARIPVGS